MIAHGPGLGLESDNAVDDNRQLHLSSSLSHISYNCGSCDYQLNLNSGNRSTSVICSKYGKQIKRGIISFFCIDESRFVQVEKLHWIPFFSSKSQWGLFQRRTKLLCRKCGNHIGNAYKESTTSISRSNTSSWPQKMRKSSYSISWDGISGCRIYDIKIRALQPSHNDNHELGL